MHAPSHMGGLPPEAVDGFLPHAGVACVEGLRGHPGKLALAVRNVALVQERIHPRELPECCWRGNALHRCAIGP